jgi:hypothetical protein
MNRSDREHCRDGDFVAQSHEVSEDEELRAARDGLVGEPGARTT